MSKGGVAQLAEQRTHKPRVTGSSPVTAIFSLVVGLSIALGSSGCIFDPFSRRLRRAQEEAGGLDQRVTTLEQSSLLSSLVGGGAGGAPPLPEDLGSEPALQAARAAAAAPQASRWPGLPIDWGKAISKLLRGLVNVITGWVEIPKRVHETTEQSGPGTGFTWGLMRGFGYGFIRTAAGGYETVTFLVPAPPGYQPVMQPAYVFLCEGDTGQGTRAPEDTATHAAP